MGRVILIVDGNSAERTILRGFLKAEYDIIEAESGNEAVNILGEKSDSISAVIMDVVMPGIGGFETLKKIKSNPHWLQIPVIITTGPEEDDSRELAIINGADNFITKPYNRALLLHTLHNVIRLREAAAVVDSLSRDKLTGMLSRDSFLSEADRMIKHHCPGYFILSCLDVENFKVINDQYGTDVGDEVLKHIALCISSFIAGLNGLPCRYSADKFAILYPAEMKDSPVISENHRKITNPSYINGSIRIRIGRYHVSDLSVPVRTMFDRASLAEASIKGSFDRYIVEYVASMRDRILSEQRIVNSMVTALADGEFEPWLQPQYNHTTGAVIGAEALVRWKRDGRYISPTEFIPVFERNGFIYEMDQYIWDRVCALLRRWIEEGRNPLPVSVNISRRDLFHRHFIQVLTGIVDKYRLPYEMVRLEVTESALSEASIIEKVDELIKLGFTVEIDDFGSGYSSLNTLKDVPASILKLDMKFFEITGNTQRAGSIIESVVRMASWLGMSVIAEGVEDKETADYLKSIGCNYIQGFYYKKPMPVEEFERLPDCVVKEPELSGLTTLDTLDNNEFWNPKSIETLIFNSYVGGACIFEYNGKKTELLRMNEQYTREMGGIIPQGTQLIDSGMEKYLVDDERDKLFEVIEKSIETRKEAFCDVRISDGSREEYIRLTSRVIARSGDRYLFYGVVRNVTSENQASLQAEKMSRMNFELNTLLYAIPSGIFKYSADEKEEFDYINRNFMESLGYTEKEFREKFHNCFSEMVYKEDRESAEQEIIAQESDGKIGKFDYRVEAADGTLHWFHDEGVKITDDEGKAWYYVTLVDITEQKEAEKMLRLAEEEYRIATKHSGRTIGRYNIAERTLTINSDAENGIDLPELIEDVPYGRVRLGRISPDTSDAYIAFYESIIHGVREGSVTFRKLLPNGWRYITEHFTTVFDAGGNPVSAIISFADVTEHREKEIAFKKWQQELESKETGSFTLYRFNLSKNPIFNTVDGTLLGYAPGNTESTSVKELVRGFAETRVIEEDRERYTEFVDTNVMLANYYRGKISNSIEFRARISSGRVHWLRLTVDLVEYPNSTDIEAYLMYDDINDSKVVELNTKRQAETDPLTGLLNRKTFAERLTGILSSDNGSLTALLLIDLDGFKLVNDNFGHSAGDQVLIDVGNAIRSIVYGGDLVCRLGGDEFIVCIKDMPGRDLILKKAKQICALTRRSFSFGIHLTVSLGISVSPDDGDSFDTLYKKADKALYYVKKSGKNGCAFYSENTEKALLTVGDSENQKVYREKCRMLIVDSNRADSLLITGMFNNEFTVDCVESGEEALSYLHGHRNEVAVILLDLIMPDMSGFTVLDRIRGDRETELIPVIVVSGICDRETNLRALRRGAYDFVSKPVDTELLRIRVQTAIERSVTEGQKAQLINKSAVTSNKEN